MKRFFYFLAASLLLAGLSACQKGQFTEFQAAEPELESYATGEFVSATYLGSQSLTKACTDAVAVLESVNVSGKQLTDVQDIPNFLYGILSTFMDVDRSMIPTFGVEVKTWRINYTSLGGFEGKEKVLLSADVAYLTTKCCKRPRVLESISLFNTSFNVAQADVMQLRDLVIPMRAAYNSLVIYPFYQGTFLDKGKHPVSPEEYLIKGRQAIDAEIATLKFFETIQEEENVYFDEDYYTECMGISNGGGTSLAVQYLLENEMTEENDKIRLAATYIGEGRCTETDTFPYILSKTESHDLIGKAILDIEDVKSGSYLSTVIGVNYTWKIDKNSPDEDNLRQAMKDEYFSEDFLNLEYGDTGMDYIDAALAGKFNNGIYGDFDGIDIRDVVNPDLVTEEGAIDMQSEPVQYLMEQFKRNDDVLLVNWTPKAPLHFTHSIADEFIPCKYVEDIYYNLSDGGTNQSVTLSHIDGLGHVSASLYCTFDEILFTKHPCPLDPPCPCKD